MRLYHHKTDGGAEYLTDTYIECAGGHREGVFEGARYIVRIDGDITKDAELSVRESEENDKSSATETMTTESTTDAPEVGSDDSLDAMAEIVEAWTNEGRCPQYHRKCKNRLSTEWPMLEKAIRKLVKASNAEAPSANQKGDES